MNQPMKGRVNNEKKKIILGKPDSCCAGPHFSTPYGVGGCLALPLFFRSQKAVMILIVR